MIKVFFRLEGTSEMRYFGKNYKSVDRALELAKAHKERLEKDTYKHYEFFIEQAGNLRIV